MQINQHDTPHQQRKNTTLPPVMSDSPVFKTSGPFSFLISLIASTAFHTVAYPFWKFPSSLLPTPFLWKCPSFFFFKALFIFIYLFIYLFLAVLGLCFRARAFSSCGKRGPLFIAVRGPLTIAASLVAEHRLQMRRLSSCGSRAQLLRGMWDLPRPGHEPVSPALAGRFSTTVPPGKPSFLLLDCPNPALLWDPF